MNMLTWPWLTEVVIITWRDIKNKQRPPIPSELLASFIVFGALSVAQTSESMNKAATVFGWGIVIATFFNFVDPTFSKNPGKNQAAQNVTPITTAGAAAAQTPLPGSPFKNFYPGQTPGFGGV
jgi:hypothetical protein